MDLHSPPASHRSLLLRKSPRVKPPPLPLPPPTPSFDEAPSTPSTPSLPPLSTDRASPRRLLPPSSPWEQQEYTVAELDAWPLISSPSPSKNSLLRPQHHESSPLSPRIRKAHARHRVLDESKSKPVLLDELEQSLSRELKALGQQESDPELSLRRHAVFRHLFQCLIDSFSVYAPILTRVKREYDSTIDNLLTKCQLIPQLHAELQTLEAQCLQTITQQQLETLKQQDALKQTLKLTQSELTAYAAQCTHLREQTARLKGELERLERRNEDLQQSNHSLVHGLKRHDETLRHVHERSREEAIVLQQMTNKYHRACDEIAELKKTITALEEKVGGVHISADKATIALLSKELQELHQQTNTEREKDGNAREDEKAMGSHVLLKILEAHGVRMTLRELMQRLQRQEFDGGGSTSPTLRRMASTHGGLTKSSSAALLRKASTVGGGADMLVPMTEDVSFVVERVSVAFIDQIRLYYQRQQQLMHRIATSSSSSTFLTENDEIHDFANVTSADLTPLVSSINYLQGHGSAADVPVYLQHDGVVRHLHYDRKRVEAIITRVWSMQDELKPRQPTTLPNIFQLFLQRQPRIDALETAYNMVAGLERFQHVSSDCRLFLLILQMQLPDDSRQDQVRELSLLHDALAVVHRETQPVQTRPGLPLADVLQTLRRVFPYKTDAAFRTLHRALLLDLKGTPLVDFATLVLPSDAAARRPSQFRDCLRSQHIDDLLSYQQHIRQQIQQLMNSSSDPMVSVRILRECLQQSDTAKPVQELNRWLLSLADLNMDQLLTQDALMVHTPSVLARLPTLLLKPTGKYHTTTDDNDT